MDDDRRDVGVGGERATFLKRFLSAPRQIGSVTPSSRSLARAMLGSVDWTEARAVAELGAGTGVFTRHIAELARPDAKILVFEIDPALRAMIERDLPARAGMRVCGDARELLSIMREEGIERLDHVLSSLPFTVLPKGMGAAILDAVQDALAPDGRFVAYQYSQIMRGELERRFTDVTRKFVLFNVPPANVYTCRGDRREA
ncbi:MAG: methyltransferase type 11 [Synergistaceae bacterium]|nr:methyltransferase type 11 [Synergistaceae bacterium]